MWLFKYYSRPDAVGVRERSQSRRRKKKKGALPELRVSDADFRPLRKNRISAIALQVSDRLFTRCEGLFVSECFKFCGSETFITTRLRRISRRVSRPANHSRRNLKLERSLYLSRLLLTISAIDSLHHVDTAATVCMQRF